MDKSVISITFCKYQDTSRDRSSDNLWAFLSPWQSFSICIICTFRWKHSYSLVKLHWLRDYWAPLFSHLTKVELHLRSGWEVIHCLLPILNSFLLDKLIKMVNFKLGNECEGELINKTRAWDKEKFWVPDRNRIHDLPNTGWALYPLSYENSWRVSVGGSEFFFVSRSCHVD